MRALFWYTNTENQNLRGSNRSHAFFGVRLRAARFFYEAADRKGTLKVYSHEFEKEFANLAGGEVYRQLEEQTIETLQSQLRDDIPRKTLERSAGIVRGALFSMARTAFEAGYRCTGKDPIAQDGSQEQS